MNQTYTLSKAQSPLSGEEVLCWLALRMTPGLGTRKATILADAFSSAQEIFRAAPKDLEAAGINPAVARSIASGCAFDDAADQQHKALEAGTTVIPITDFRYPAALRTIFDAPPVLFALGRVELLESIMLGVVGTRRPTPYGVQAAERLSKELCEAGMTIVSGMARGIDTAAHKAVLATEGNTVAVFGCGVDQIYPAENRKLAREIAERGLIVSEFPMGSPPYPQNFPIRNRIVSGLSVGVLVVEGSEYSGSAITAKLAAEQNRGVFAVPGNITSKMSWGPNQLIKQGAKLVQDWNDVASELPTTLRRQLVDLRRQRLAGRPAAVGKEPPASPQAVQAQAILRLIQPDQAVSLDSLLDRMEGTPASEIMASLFDLELSGMVRQLPGKQYIRVWTD